MRHLADVFSGFSTLALVVCAGLGLVVACAPPQHLPWTPLNIDAPIGTATRAKVTGFEVSANDPPDLIEARTQACMQTLRDAGVQVVRAPDQDDGGFCQVRGAVRITGGQVTPITPAGLVMQCPLAVRYVVWDRQVLKPAAAALGTTPARVESFGTYSCRRIYGSVNDFDRPSEHARANALDVGGVRLADGRTVSVLNDWSGTGPAGPEAASFLRTLRDGACRVFGAVLTPDYNAAHANHLHLDGAPYSLCATGPSRAERARLEAQPGPG